MFTLNNRGDKQLIRNKQRRNSKNNNTSDEQW